MWVKRFAGRDGVEQCGGGGRYSDRANKLDIIEARDKKCLIAHVR